MESEKVKEIKKALECCSNPICEDKCYYHSIGCMNELSKDSLTIINELESENERLVESCKNCHYIKDLEIANGHAKELKDRIAELEEDKEKWQIKAVNYYQMAKSYGIECIIDNDIDELLKGYEK